MLKIENLSFSYNLNSGKKILEDISLEVFPGDLTAILGENGTGKSTLLKCVNKIETAQGGNISIDDVNINEIGNKELAKKIAYVAQYTAKVHATVFETILLGIKPYIKFDCAQKDIDIVNTVLKRLGLENYSMKFIDQVSGGELQKIVFARALAQEPSIMILDEPTSNLDMKNQHDILNIVKGLCEDENMSILITIHDINLALRYCNKFVLIKNGKVYSVGGKETITVEAIKDVYKVDVEIIEFKGNKVIIPIS